MLPTQGQTSLLPAEVLRGWQINKTSMKLSGELTLPGDKSISHRAILLSAFTRGKCVIENLSTGRDVESTRQCLLRCGIESMPSDITPLVLSGKALKTPTQFLDCGNSGTTARLLAGLLSGQQIACTLAGDSSLSKRPMERIIEPLSRMGSCIHSQNGCLPLKIQAKPLKGIEYTLPVASAQVKSCILLAGLSADGQTTVIENLPTRNHTENLLNHLGDHIRVEGKRITISPLKEPLSPFKLSIPGDPSSAAFFAAGATLLAGSELILKNLLLNPTRMGFYKALQKMGGKIETLSKMEINGEETGDLRITSNRLNSIILSAEDIPEVIDEIPILAILATQAEGTTEIRGAKELRVKESDRIKVLCENLLRMGARVTEREDGLIIEGPTPLYGTPIATHKDHRIAMAFTIAQLIAQGTVSLDDSTCISISFPEFHELLKKVIQ